MNRFMLIAVGVVLLLMLCSCAGSNMLIKAERSRYAISSSPVVFTSDGTILRPENQVIVGRFWKKYHRWSIFSTLIPLSKYERDISNDLEKEIEVRKGSAVVNLTVESNLSKFSQFVANFLPLPVTTFFLPSSIDVEVSGDIIKPKDDSVSIYIVPKPNN